MRKQALIAIGEAEAQGFEVREDLSLVDKQTSSSPDDLITRQAQAESLGAEIRSKATALAVIDAERAAAMTAAVATVDELEFSENPIEHTIQAVDWKQSPAEDGAGDQTGPQPPRGLPPEGVHPPVPGDVTAGPASRPSEAGKGGQSLWDENGGEWRYFPGDKYHNPHWDFNPHNVPNAPWDNVPIGDLPPVKGNPITAGLPPWLDNPAAPGVPGPPHNPLLAPFPGTDVATPPPIPSSGPVSMFPRIDLPAPNPEDMANAGAAGTGVVAGGGLLVLLYTLFVQN